MSSEDYQTQWEYLAEQEVPDRPSRSGDRALESRSRTSGFEPCLRQIFSHDEYQSFSYDEYQTFWESSAEQYSSNRPRSSGDRAPKSHSGRRGFEPRLRQSFFRPQEGDAEGIVVEVEAPRVVPVEVSLGLGAQNQQAGQSGSETHSQRCFSRRTGQWEPPPPPAGDKRGEG